MAIHSEAPENLVLSVIIISYNTREMTLECLRTLYSDLGTLPAEVWIVDNASQDGSVEAIRSAYPQVRLIANERNLGFGAANNQAMREACGKYFLLLNSDAFPKAGAIGKLVEYLDTHPEVGLVGPRLLNGDGSLQISCFRFPSPGRAWFENLWIAALLPNHRVFGDYRRWAHDVERQVDSIIGACMLVRREAFAQTGGFDERYFMYQEETDWQKCLREKGWRVAFFPAAVVTHLGGASGAGEPARINRHFFESLDYYEWKHHGLPGLISLRIAMAIGCSMRLILWIMVMLAFPKRRARAYSKSRLHSWLFVRQATHWRLG